MAPPPLPSHLASGATAPSTSCLSARLPHRLLPAQMCLICTCIAARLRRCEPLKMWSKTRTDGTPIPRVVRSFARSSPSGCGTRLLELGQKLSSSELRTTEFAPAVVVEPPPAVEPACSEKQTPQVQYASPQWARPSFTGGFPGSAFTLQADGTLRCPANHPLYLQERRPERDGSLRVLYAARIGHCRSCPLRAQCQESSTTIKPRRVSAVLWPIDSSPPTCSSTCSDGPPPSPLAPVLWRDWPRCSIRRTWLKVIRSQTLCLENSLQLSPSEALAPMEKVLTRAERAHWRLSWEQRLARNARLSNAPRLVVTLHGLPATFASSFGFDLLAIA